MFHHCAALNFTLPQIHTLIVRWPNRWNVLWARENTEHQKISLHFQILSNIYHRLNDGLIKWISWHRWWIESCRWNALRKRERAKEKNNKSFINPSAHTCLHEDCDHLQKLFFSPLSIIGEWKGENCIMKFVLCEPTWWIKCCSGSLRKLFDGNVIYETRMSCCRIIDGFVWCTKCLLLYRRGNVELAIAQNNTTTLKCIYW